MDTTFEYVDRLFSGLVYFVFNLVESIVSLFKNPVRGTLRLTSRSLNVNVRQASYRTILFFINATMFVAFCSIPKSQFGNSGESFFESLVSMSERPKLISTIIYATVATAISELYIKQRRRAERSSVRRANVFQIRFGYAFCFITSLLFFLEIAWQGSIRWMPEAWISDGRGTPAIRSQPGHSSCW